MPTRVAAVRAAMAAGMQAICTTRSLAVTVYAKEPKSPLTLSLPALLVSNTVHQFGWVSAGSVQGNADVGGATYPNTYQLDLICDVRPVNQDQAARDDDTDFRDAVIEAIEDYFGSQTGQSNPDAGNVRTTEWIEYVRTTSDAQGTSREYRGQQVWGAVTEVQVIEPDRPITND